MWINITSAQRAAPITLIFMPCFHYVGFWRVHCVTSANISELSSTCVISVT